MNATSIDIKDILEAESNLGLLFGQNLFVAKQPALPNNTVVIFDTPGSPPMLTLTPGENYFYDAVQIRIRDKDYLTGYQLAYMIMTSLHGRAQETWNDTLYSVIYCSSGPALLEWDSNNRAVIVINFEVQRR
ncbi:MAG: minor capsid protein [Bacteroidales bacterium]